MRKIGLFGGTFDPPHVGHLALAEWAREQLGLERVIFMPAGAPPHKRRPDLVSVARRVAMTRLAVRGNPAFVVSAFEARRRGPSYTVDTLRALAREHAGARLYLILGADSLGEFRTWHEPGGIRALAMLAVAARPGAGRAGGGRRPRPPRGVVWLDNPGFDLSSSAIRARVRAGCSIRYLVPEAVARYIARHRLYRGSS